MKHTELPWKFTAGTENDPNALIESAEAYICQTVAGNDEANAQFIVKACNNHYKLLEALKELTEAANHVAVGSLFEPVDKALKAIEEAEK